jgi:pimeloyl-ACP methyl ester carboxylesterase
LSACSTLFAVHEQQERADQIVVISGIVDTDYQARGPLIVGLLAEGSSGPYLVDHFVAEKPGPWLFGVGPGSYWLAAYEDADADGRYDDEPALRGHRDKPLRVAAGDRLTGIELRIPRQGRFADRNFELADLAARDVADQHTVSLWNLSVAGEVTTLDDPRFDRDIANAGMWRYYDFLLKAEAGVYFLQEYDPDKIPVLFVHGIVGTPRDFTQAIAALDRERFQPWVFYYPSGARLESLATILTQLFVRLRIQYGFERAAVVAHSMGGLVTRQFVLQDYETNGTKVVEAYVTVSSPLGGMAVAGDAVKRSPVVVHSWSGLAPGSDYLDGLFYMDPATRSARRRLPPHIAYHMLFGFHGSSGDGVVAISSQLRLEAQEEARSLRGFDETHTGILSNPAALARLNEILAAVD